MENEEESLASMRARIAKLQDVQVHLWKLKQMDEAFEHETPDEPNMVLRDRLWIGDFASAIDDGPWDAIVSVGTFYNLKPDIPRRV